MADAPLHERLGALAMQMYEKAWEMDPESGLPPMRDFATTVSEFARIAEEEYARLADGEPFTNAQGVSLARTLGRSNLFRAVITKGTHGLAEDYLHVDLEDVTPDDGRREIRTLGFTCGIAPDGRVSS